jgi:lipid A 3-O-deacylase
VDSPSVQKDPLVADLSAGLSLFWSDRAKLDLVVTWRSKEFVGQPEDDRYGGINFSCKLP